MPNSDTAFNLVLIDDDDSIVRLISSVIAKHFEDQVTLESFTDPAQAMERLKQGAVDILITDFEMPEINGLELLQFAKKINPCCQVVCFTGKSTQENILAALELGATDYLLKPISHAELIMLITQAHERAFRWRRALVSTWRKSKNETPATAICPPVECL